MTPEQRANVLLAGCFYKGEPLPDYNGPSAVEIAGALRAAVLEEREACAKLAEAHPWRDTDACRHIAAAIRARS